MFKSKKFSLFVCALTSALLLGSCFGSNNNDTQTRTFSPSDFSPIINIYGIKTQIANTDLKTMKYYDAVKILKSIGFKNYRIDFNYQASNSKGSKENEIKEITINGTETFNESTYFPEESLVYLNVYSDSRRYEFTRTPIYQRVPAMFNSSEFVGEFKNDTVKLIKQAGILNILLIPIFDCQFTYSYGYNRVEKITISGIEKFEWYTSIYEYEPYIIYYHELIENQNVN